MLTHIDDTLNPGMVDVAAKAITQRTAHARATVVFPETAYAALAAAGFENKKGPVFTTAILAGVMAAKATSTLIPLCHPIALENCKLTVTEAPPDRLVVDCRVSATHKTGVEMEALTGASVAALTIYDMCKALSHGIVIEQVHLVSKTGGKSDYRVEA
jgi:cyclic pyranopterin phosphate synthase